MVDPYVILKIVKERELMKVLGFKDREIIEGKWSEAYYDLHDGKFSMCQSGLVVVHADNIWLKDCKMASSTRRIFADWRANSPLKAPRAILSLIAQTAIRCAGKSLCRNKNASRYVRRSSTRKSGGVRLDRLTRTPFNYRRD